uniref:Uncharacterized protein n=1 Tax=Utricularia reniformis TaxID=192314 RepID=A0A1Y0AZL6_9LAMI|nr:hypothetical protein AEK19_MT0308 [Utricularia reniformis]ART30583.1 hypothetical protein AEK19_MT0308 [Utricularia reniformis]
MLQLMNKKWDPFSKEMGDVFAPSPNGSARYVSQLILSF